MPDQPYETQRQAHAAAVAAIPPEDGLNVLSDAQNRQLLARALEEQRSPGLRSDGDRGMAEPRMPTVAEIARWIETAAQPPGGTVTEWAIRVADPDSGRTDESMPVASEEVARAAVPAWRRGGSAQVAVVSRQVGPWTEAPEPEEDEGR